ncbi:hypothetical protein AB0K48_51900, partial [Nonomuraea sp. NPDC055795]
MSRLIKSAFTTVALSGALALLATSAGAVPSSQNGTQTSAQSFTGENSPWTAQTIGAWGNIPTASVNVTVPAGTTRFVDARFTAESICVGAARDCFLDQVRSQMIRTVRVRVPSSSL